MRTTFTILTLLLGSGTCLAGDVALTLTGTVRTVAPNPTGGAFVGASPGDPFQLRVEVDYPTAFPGGEVTWLYFGDPAGSSLSIGGVSAGVLPTRVEVQHRAAGDRIRIDAQLGGAFFQGILDGPGGAFVQSIELAQSLGTSTLSTATTNLISLTGNGGQLTFEATSIAVDLVPAGIHFCAASQANSTGQAGVISAFGSPVVAEGSLFLHAGSLPTQAFGLFLCSRTPGLPVPPPGGLCLGGAVGRFAGQVRNSGSTGSFAIPVDLNAFPQPNQSVAVLPGETWYFQAWHRDTQVGQATYGLTGGAAVTFQ